MKKIVLFTSIIITALYFQSSFADKIYKRCKSEWGNDSGMVRYCVEKQNKAKKELNRAASSGSLSSNIKVHDKKIMKSCKSEWENDYVMQEYCTKKQENAKKHLSKRNLSKSKLKSCKDKWKDDYAMVKYCMKNTKSSSEKKYTFRGNTETNYSSGKNVSSKQLMKRKSKKVHKCIEADGTITYKYSGCQRL